jgi:metal-responsive CopG/Arc/MetJ family transcriptional regulator
MSKKRVSYHIAEQVLKDFDSVAKNNAINKSALIELLIKKWIEDKDISSDEKKKGQK